MAEQKRVHFDPTINLGHVISALAFVGSVLFAWTNMDKRVLVLEEASKLQTQLDRHQDQVMSMNMSQIREALAEIKQTQQRINDKLERKE